MTLFRTNRLLVGLVYFFLVFPLISIAQISGITIDSKTGKPLPGVEVFINKATVGIQSDELGQFALQGTATGFHEIILFKKGYELYRSSIKIQNDRQYKLQLSLVPHKKKKLSPLSETEIKLLKDKLVNHIAGDSVVFLNIEQMEAFDTDGQHLFTGAPLMVQNNKTGYIQHYYLGGLPIEAISQAPVWFESLVSQDVKQTIAWEQNRKECFTGSLRHWLISMVSGRVQEEGYVLKDVNGKNIDTKSLFNSSALSDYNKLTIDHPLTVIYKNENGVEETSQVKSDGAVDVNARGLMINFKGLDVQGAMATITLSDQLPVDYQPIKGDVADIYAKTIERFYEKVYVHTDKPYYYPGEPMWFKGYINYKEPLWRDSLSKVMYVELIDPMNDVTLSKTLKIDSGFFHNDFILPDSLKEGTYYLRAYTNLNRNFGDSSLFIKPIPVLKITDKATSAAVITEPAPSENLSITSNKQVYKPREKVILTLQTKDKEGNPLTSNLSLSVTDIVRVIPVTKQMTILNSFHLEERNNESRTLELKYPVEYGVGFRGRFLNDKGRPEKIMLSIFQLKPRRMMMAMTDEQGFFDQSSLDFYDTATFSFKADKATDFVYGKVELLPRDIASLNFNRSQRTMSIPVETTQFRQRIISEYEVPKDVRMLEEVEVKASRIEEQYQEGYRVKRTYGKPDYVLKGKDINTAYWNLNMSLIGKVPGLIVRPEATAVFFSRAATQSVLFGSGPLVTVNDVPMYGEAYEILSRIDPTTVESVEFKNGINVLYGSQGANGVISVYTKKGVSEKTPAPNFQTIQINGYASARKFKAPDYTGNRINSKAMDFRSTIYWNPEIIIDAKNTEASVSFFAADLPGKYRIIAEGVLGNGEPVRAEYFIDVESN